MLSCVFYSRFPSRPRSATLSLSRLPSSPNLQSSPHLCRMGQTLAKPPLLPSWTTRSQASCPCRSSPKVKFRARFLCCNPLTLREHHLGLPVPVWLSRNRSVLSQELQVRVQQRLIRRYGHMSHFHTWLVLTIYFFLWPPCFAKIPVHTLSHSLYILWNHCQEYNLKWNT